MSQDNAPFEVTAANFEQEVVQSPLPVVVDFWAPWCGPCKTISPLLDELAEEFAGRVRVGKVNVDEQQPLAQAFAVRSIPTLAAVRGGEITELQVGFRGRAQVAALFEKIAG